jgi:hypothetical protein
LVDWLKGQLGHPDEINAKKISSRLNRRRISLIAHLAGQVGQADDHGLKKKVCFAFGEKGHIAGRQLRMSGHGSAARRFVLICDYLCKSCLPRCKQRGIHRKIIIAPRAGELNLYPPQEGLSAYGGLNPTSRETHLKSIAASGQFVNLRNFYEIITQM